MNVLVLMGGDSPEREVSLRSGEAVVKALHAAGIRCSAVDPSEGLDRLDQLGAADIVFPILHGAGGEDGAIQGELEKRHLKYLGTRAEESRVCFNKHLTRQVLKAAGLPVARGEQVTMETYKDSVFRNQAHVLKAVGGGSSIGTLIARKPEVVTQAQLDGVFTVSSEAVIEELIEGIEVTVPILGEKALPVIEIRPPAAGDFDYENKYNGKTAELCPPISIDQQSQAYVQSIAEKVHTVLGARHLSRVDMIIKPDGKAVVLELNTIPGMTGQSLYPKSAAAAGWSFPELMKQFVRLVTYNDQDPLSD